MTRCAAKSSDTAGYKNVLQNVASLVTIAGMKHPLTAWRERNSVGPTEFARRLKVDRRTIYRYEAGEVRPSDEIRVRIEELTDGEVPYTAWRPPPHSTSEAAT